jgi:DNA-binding transcriptional LysR family regulator
MDLLQLRYFQTVARTEHITKAAEELHISQPSLSKIISKLEKDLDVPLFDRKGRQIKLSIYGNAFLPKVNRIFMELESGINELSDMKGKENNKVSVAINVMSFFPEIYMEYLKLFPNTCVRQTSGTLREMRQQLENGTIDYCISSPPIKAPNIEYINLSTEELCLIVPQGHKFANRKSINLDEAADEQFLCVKEGFGMRDLTEKMCYQAGFSPNIIFESDTASRTAELVNRGFGIALYPVPLRKTREFEYLTFLHIKRPVCTREIGLSFVRNHYMSKSARKFKDFVIDYFNAKKQDVSN